MKRLARADHMVSTSQVREVKKTAKAGLEGSFKCQLRFRNGQRHEAAPRDKESEGNSKSNTFFNHVKSGNNNCLCPTFEGLGYRRLKSSLDLLSEDHSVPGKSGYVVSSLDASQSK